MTSPLLDYTEAAAYLRVSHATVKKLVARGRITHVKLGTRVFFTRGDLDGFIESSRVEAEAKAAASARRVDRRAARAGGPNLSVIGRARS